MMSLQDNPGRANAAVLMGLLHPGWFYDGKERSVRSDVRLQFVLLLFMMRKVCDGSLRRKPEWRQALKIIRKTR
jgi:hypothetical protein